MSKETIVTDKDVPANVIAAVVEGRRIVAIKLLREATGIGLANAKVIVDRLSLQHAPRDYSHSPFREESSSGRFVLWIGLLVASVAAWQLLA